MATATTAQVKLHNRQQVIEHIYRHKRTSKQDIMRELNMSLPTITQNLRSLEEERLIRRSGFLQSTGGRKPQVYAFNNRTRLAIGVRMNSKEIIVCAVDLYGTCFKRATGRLAYAHSEAYYHRVAQFINQFIDSLHVEHQTILGVAFSLQGIVSSDGSTITFGKILGNTGLSINMFASRIDYPCIFIHDSDASAMAELRLTPNITDALCLYLDTHMGGAVIIDGKLRQGNAMKNGTIEHMTMVPDGKTCYCGRKGCLDAYCSGHALLEYRDEDPEDFFNQVRDDEYLHRRIFNIFMDNLAHAIKNMRTVLDCDVIVGGQVGQFFTVDDMVELKSRIRMLDSFPDSSFRLRKSVCIPDQCVVGAALVFVDAFVNELCGR